MDRLRPTLFLLLFIAASSLAWIDPTSRPATQPATMATTRIISLKNAPPRPSFDPLNSATEAESVDSQLRAIQSAVNADVSGSVVQSQLPALTTEIAARLDETDRLVVAAPSLQVLENQEQDWTAIHEELVRWADELKRQRARLQDDSNKTNADGPLINDWRLAKTFAEYFEQDPKRADLARSVLKIIDTTIDHINDTNQMLYDRSNVVTGMILAVNSDDAQATQELEAVRESRAGAFNRLFVRNDVPVWNMFRQSTGKQTVAQESADSFNRQVSAVWAYIQRRWENAGGQLLLVIGLTVLLHFLREKVSKWAEKDPGFDRAKLLFASPIATAVVLSILGSAWIYPQAPRLFWAIMGAAALIPTVIILRRLIDRRLFPILNALVVFYFMDQIRAISAAVPIIARPLFIFEMLGAALLLFSFIRDIRKQDGDAHVWELIRVVAWLEFTTFAVACIANAIGYVSVANLMGDAVLKSAYFAVILYACVSIMIGLLVIALRTRPLALLGMVQRHQALILRRLTRAVRWIAALGWVYGLLAALSVASATVDLARRAFNAEVGFANFHVSLGPLTEFLLIMWASFVVSRFLRFVLEEDVYERLPLPGGSAYAISKVLNYIVLLIGFFVALHVLNYNMTQFTILASAFGVGLGFGMQNIVNNFVSGLILLFERPVKVGDVIQMGDVNGIVSYIGIRASVLRTPDSSEIIIPNGNLISSQVTNWTHTNRLRGMTIPISTAATVDPKQVMDLMTRTATENSQIVRSPAPQAFLIKFGADTFSFELHVWTNEAVHWIHIRSDLSVALNAAFVKENIPIR